MVCVAGTVAKADWKPPENPDPSKIRDEAIADRKAKRYEEALAKHVWYHEKALTTPGGENLGPVRVSFALADWFQLAHRYPPALEKLKFYRDAATQRVRDGKDGLASFQEVNAINGILDEEPRTLALFLWLHTNKMDIAKEVYAWAEPVLVRAQLYDLCGVYLDRPEKTYERLVRGFRTRKENPSYDHEKQRNAFQEKYFANRVTSLVALLTVNDRNREAQKIVAAATKEWGDPEFAKQIEVALKGLVPEPWPPPLRPSIVPD